MSPTNLIIVGLSVPRQNKPFSAYWAYKAHFSPIKKLPKDYKLVAVLNSSKESSQNAIDTLEIEDAEAVGSIKDLFSRSSINYDAVVVSVKVPSHTDYVIPVLQAGKQVLCEWPLARNLEEAEQIIKLVHAKDLKTLVVLQSRASPGILKVKELVESGLFGKVTASEFHGISQSHSTNFDDYREDVNNGANLLTIPFGHSIDAILFALGSYFKEVTSTIDTLIGRETRTSPDHVYFHGLLNNGIYLTGSLRGGVPSDISTAFRWEIHGQKGDLLVTSDQAYSEMATFSISYVLHSDNIVHKVEMDDDNYNYEVDSVHRLYEAFAGLKDKSFTRQSFANEGYPTFEDALILHRLLDAITRSSHTGQKVNLEQIQEI